MAEGREEGMLEEAEAANMAAAWRFAHGETSEPGLGGWGTDAGVAASSGQWLSSSGVAVTEESHGVDCDANAAAVVHQAATSRDGAVMTRQQTWMPASGPQSSGQHASRPDAKVQFLSRYWFLVDDLVGDDKVAALQRLYLPVLAFYLVSVLQRCLTALFFGLYHFHYVSISQLTVLMVLHALFIWYLIAARPYASKLMLAADVIAYSCELTILGTAVVLKQAPANSTVLAVLVTCYFVDIAVMLLPEIMRYVQIGYKWLQCRRPLISSSQVDIGMAAEEAATPCGTASGPSCLQDPKRKRGKAPAGTILTPWASDSGAVAGASAAAAAALQLTKKGCKHH